MLQAVVLVFMLFLCALCLFAVIVIVRDIIHENTKIRREREISSQATAPVEPIQVVVQPAPTVIMPAPVAAEPAPAPVAETIVEAEEQIPEEVAATEEDEELDPDAVSFSRGSLTMEEKYAALSSEQKRYFDDIVRHAMSKEGVKEAKRGGFYDYKIGAYRVIKMMIKRSEIVCEFNFIDKDFAEYASSSDVKMKRSATSVRVLEPSAVGVAKDGIDLVCSQIAEDKERKKELAREKRREKRKQAKEA
jgi:hypothetical protein